MPTATPHLYVSSDLADGQTLDQWRYALNVRRRTSRRRPLHLPSLRLRLGH